MKNNFHVGLFQITIFCLFLFLFISCKKENKYSLPVLTTTVVTGINKTFAVTGGTINSDGGAVIKTRGICWSTNPVPTIIDTKTSFDYKNASFQDTAANLLPNTTYYVRAYASNIVGWGYGNVVSFTTPNVNVQFNPNLAYGTLSDIDGNKYKTLTIGTQTWMAENLKVTHYRNGDPIPNVKDSSTWSMLSKGAYCDYVNSPENSATYGKLYNWFCVSDPRNIAPPGWHVPSFSEIYILITYLGGSPGAGDKLKEMGSINWSTPSSSTNASGFTALAGGDRQINGKYENKLLYSIWWCNESSSNTCAYYWLLYNNNSYVSVAESGNKAGGFSVRLIKDD
ncbi:MAG: fibrobacter succinogenes major paralogous domain-containing protein [Bacteroidota bacterium]|nr:fibrobacter succinogenes major paralogous domain-containing protein [Bacteroidota bacterium]